MTTNMTQNDLILSHLKEGKSITAIEALEDYGCFRLAARIKNLKDNGVQIESKMVKQNSKRFSVYRLARKNEL